MKKQKGKICGLVIFLLSFVAMLIYNRFGKEFFLCDDNITQWYPVMETAYSELFESGTMPVYDFYQLKGMSIVEQGYYGITNPIMLLCYAAVRIFHIPLSCLSLYITLLVSCGNVIMYAFLREVKCGIGMSAAGVIAYSSFSAFFSQYIWYYIFNNYLIIPLIFLVMTRCRGRRLSYVSVGIVLAMSIYLGNVQYTFYHYMLYGILGLGTVVFAGREYIKKMLSNIAVGLILSAPVFVLLLGAAQGFNADGNGFLDNHIAYNEAVLYCFIPFHTLETLGADLSQNPLGITRLMGRNDGFLLYTAACSVPIIIMLVIAAKDFLKGLKAKPQTVGGDSLGGGRSGLIGEFKKKIAAFFSDKEKRQMLILPIALLVFADIGCGGIVAHILSVIPVIKQFRYLFKAIFVFIPIYVIFTVIIISRLPLPRRKTVLSVCLAFGILGCVNNYSSVWVTNDIFTTHKDMTATEKISYAAESVERCGMDTVNYRSVCILEMPGYRGATDNYFKNLSRNLPTAIGAFSLSGYEISIPENRLEQFSRIMDPTSVFTGYANASDSVYFLESLEEHPVELGRELAANGVKYFIVPKPDIIELFDFSDDIISGLNGLDGIEVVRTGSFSDEYDFIEINGVSSICTDENGVPATVTAERMDLLSVEISDTKELNFSLAYDEGLTAYAADASGTRTALAISEKEDGNISVDVSGAEGQTVYLGYSKRIYPIAFVFETATAILFAANIAAVLFLKKDGVKK